MLAAEQLITANLDIWSSAIKAKSAAGRGKSNKLELYGVKKLRELILELAVRGLLVQQDSNDEPASELLKKVAAEKAQLIKDGKIRKRKKLADVAEDEKVFGLPDSWDYARLNDLGDWGAGATPSRRSSELYGGDIPWFKSGELVGDYISESEEYVTQLALEKASLRYNQKGDVLIAMYGATIGKVSILSVPATTNQAVCACTPFTGVENIFLLTLLKAYKNRFIGMGAGGAQPNISREKIITTVVALPPTAEQNRIVAKVDELMALCDHLEQQQESSITAHQTLVQTLLDALTAASERDSLTARGGGNAENAGAIFGLNAAWARIADHFDTLFTTEWSIDQLKQTILQLAVRGKLVQQDTSDSQVDGISSGDANPFGIPDDWEWKRVDDFAVTRLGKMLDKAKNKGKPYRYLRNINVRWFDFDLADVKEMLFEDSERDEFSLHTGDVLICEGGYPGRAAVWDERETDIYFQKALHRVRLPESVSPYYFALALRESVDSERISSYFTGAGIQHFTGKGLKSFLVPLPPITEQHRIVAKVDELMTLCDTLKARLSTAQTTQFHLADAMAEQAVV